MNKITALMAIGAIAIPLAACGSSSNSSSSTGSTAAAASSSSGSGSGSSKSTETTKTTKTTVANSASAKSGEIKVNMVDDAFQPKAIVGKAGSTVKVELKNTGSNEHNFKIDSQKKADADVEPGEDATVTVKIPTSGSVQFYCEYHKGLGMVGTVKAA
jgi:plastocyanin